MKVGINGFGRVGRQVLKALMERHPQYEVVQINDIADTKTLAHLFKYDSTYGVYSQEVSSEDNTMTVGKNSISMTHFTDLNTIEWQKELKWLLNPLEFSLIAQRPPYI